MIRNRPEALKLCPVSVDLGGMTHNAPADVLARIEAALAALPIELRESVLEQVESYGDARADEAWSYATR